MKIRKTCMSHILSLAMAVLLAALLCACSGKADAPQNQSAPDERPPETAAVQTTAAPETTPPATTAAPETTAAPTTAAVPETTAAAQTKASGGSGWTGKAEGFLGMSGNTDEAEAFSAEGSYTLFGVLTQGYEVTADSLGAKSVIVLEEDGTGSLAFNEEKMEVTDWSLEGDRILVTLEDESSAEGTFLNGIIELDIYGTGEMLFYYTQEGADTSSYELITMDELQQMMDEGKAGIPEKDNGSRLAAVWKSLDGSTGIHLNYDVYLDYFEAVQEYDVHILDGEYYSLRKSYISGYTQEMITFLSGGKAYNLYPEDMTGILVTETSSSIILDHPERMDQLVQDIYMNMQRTDYYEDTMDISGETYSAEVYPAGSGLSEAIFCFDGDGNLAFYICSEDPDAETPSMTDAVYTIHSIDGQVQTSVFDISEYTIE